MPIPRRVNYQKMVPAERLILKSMQETEKIGADPKLTEAITLLNKAKDLISDYIDNN